MHLKGLLEIGSIPVQNHENKNMDCRYFKITFMIMCLSSHIFLEPNSFLVFGISFATSECNFGIVNEIVSRPPLIKYYSDY